VFVLAVVISVAGACGDEAEVPFVELLPAALAADAVAPVPAGSVVLWVTGGITRPNVGTTLCLDLATLEQLRIVSYYADDSGPRVAARSSVGCSSPMCSRSQA
jgi:hypothetical protein